MLLVYSTEVGYRSKVSSMPRENRLSAGLAFRHFYHSRPRSGNRYERVSLPAHLYSENHFLLSNQHYCLSRLCSDTATQYLTSGLARTATSAQHMCSPKLHPPHPQAGQHLDTLLHLRGSKKRGAELAPQVHWKFSLFLCSIHVHVNSYNCSRLDVKQTCSVLCFKLFRISNVGFLHLLQDKSAMNKQNCSIFYQ